MAEVAENADASLKASDSGGPIELPSYSDLSHAADIKDGILQAIGDVDQIVINGSKVERMDTSVIQLLVAARESLAGESVDVVFSEPSEVMTRSFSDLGLADELELWSTGK